MKIKEANTFSHKNFSSKTRKEYVGISWTAKSLDVNGYMYLFKFTWR